MLAAFIRQGCVRASVTPLVRTLHREPVRCARFGGRASGETMKTAVFDGVRLADSVPVRPLSHLWRAAAFAAGVGCTSFVVASVVDFERYWKNRPLAALRPLKEWVEGNRQFREGFTCFLVLFALNATVFVLWQLPQLQPTMWKFFANGFASKLLCQPMLLSAFSHYGGIHFALNMYVLYSFCPQVVDRFLGREQFFAFYTTAAVMSSLTGITHKALTRSSARALGASGAILGLLAYTCMKVPDARLQIIFMPFFDFSAKQGIYGVLAIDILGLLLGWRIFDHAAHLGGSLFGIWYALYGERLIWHGDFRSAVVRRYRAMRYSNN